MIIIGITGTIGAGKGTIVSYLVNTKGFRHYSVRVFLIKEIEKRDMPVNRDSMVVVANELRGKHSPAYIVEQLYNEAVRSGENCIIESIRTPGEVNALRAKGNFYLLAVDANPESRYQRIKGRNSETDQIDFNTFLENEKREMSSTDPAHQNIHKCIEMADFTLTNNQTIDGLHVQVNAILTALNN